MKTLSIAGFKGGDTGGNGGIGVTANLALKPGPGACLPTLQDCNALVAKSRKGRRKLECARPFTGAHELAKNVDLLFVFPCRHSFIIALARPNVEQRPGSR